MRTEWGVSRVYIYRERQREIDRQREREREGEREREMEGGRETDRKKWVNRVRVRALDGNRNGLGWKWLLVKKDT